jgi:hypothetical protein
VTDRSLSTVSLAFNRFRLVLEFCVSSVPVRLREGDSGKGAGGGGYGCAMYGYSMLGCGIGE